MVAKDETHWATAQWGEVMNDATAVSISGTKSTLSECLAEFVEQFDFNQVPVEVLTRAKLNILDALVRKSNLPATLGHL